MRTIRDALHHGAARLQTAGIENPRLEARLLLAHALGKEVAALLRDQDSTICAPSYEALLSRRAACEPLALIIGRREFWSLDFEVSPATLIPRPDSETLIQAALAAICPSVTPAKVGITGGNTIPAALDARLREHGGAGYAVLDLGTGTGCLLIAILSEFPGAFGVGVDRSSAAAALALRNAAMLDMGGRTSFVCGDWAAALNGQFDLVLCNPPYIATADLDTLMPDVASYEPASALDGGSDGYDAYRRIIPELQRLLKPCGVAILEVGQGQASKVAGLAQRAGFVSTARADLSGIDRALVLCRRLP